MTTEPEGRLQEAPDALKMSSLDGAGQEVAFNLPSSTSAPGSAAGASHPSASAAVGRSSATAVQLETRSNSVPEPSEKAKGKEPVQETAVEHEAHTDMNMDKEKDKDQTSRKDSLSIEWKTSGPSKKASGGACHITLLLPTNARHPYKIDERYLTKRNITTPELGEDGRPNPFSISVYTLKELILREWRAEWNAAPASPTSIRLIFFGKELDDKLPLSRTPIHRPHCP